MIEIYTSVESSPPLSYTLSKLAQLFEALLHQPHQKLVGFFFDIIYEESLSSVSMDSHHYASNAECSVLILACCSTEQCLSLISIHSYPNNQCKVCPLTLIM